MKRFFFRAPTFVRRKRSSPYAPPTASPAPKRLAMLIAKVRGYTAVLKYLPHNLDLTLLCLVLMGAAMWIAILTATKGSEVFAHVSSKINLFEDKKIAVKRFYLRNNDYLEYAPTLIRLNPGVTFSLAQDGNALAVAIGDEDLFPDMMMALHTLQSFKPSVGWEMIEFCARKCKDDGVISRAVVKGFTQEIGR